MKPFPALLAMLLSATAAASSTSDAPDKVDALVKRAMTNLHIPGLALAVIKDGKPIKVGAYGLASVDYDVPVKTDTPFLLASMTKSFTATGIMMLVEQGKVSLDAPISTYLSDAPEAWKEIAVRELLSHTAGLKDRFEDDPKNPAAWHVIYTEETMYDKAKQTPLDFHPGERFQYSDQGYFLLGRIIEQVSGEKYGQFLKEKIFDPLEMTHSSTISLSRIVKGLATGYTQANGVLYHNHRRMEFGLVSHFGIISTVEDLAKWDASLYGEKLLKRATWEQMWKPALLKDGSETYTGQYGSYGFGWFVDTFNGHRSVGHGGATGTAILRFPEDKLTIVVLTNLEQLAGGDAPGIARQISRIYIPALAWSALKPKPDPHADGAAKVKAALESLAAGKAEEADYDPVFLAQIRPTLPQQKAGLGPLGPLQSLEYLDGRPLGTGYLARYLTKYKDVTLYGTAWIDGKGRIAYLGLEAGQQSD